MREFHLDLALCLDVSGNMREHLDRAREQMKRLPELIRDLYVFRSHPCSMRVRLIAFSDYMMVGEQAVRLTEFYDYPDEEDELWAELDGLEARGGFGNRKSGLEALAYGIRSQWAREDVNVKIVALWSNGTTREMGLTLPAYPPKMAKSQEELAEWWRALGRDAVLFLFTPAEGAWRTLAETWENVLLIPSRAGEGLEDDTLRDIVGTLEVVYGS